MMYFTRVAKSGSTSFMGLLIHQSTLHNYNVIQKRKTMDIITEPFDLKSVENEVKSVLKERKPRVLTKHYAFIDFAKFGYKWSPDWLAIVRDPLERIISAFYYNRAAWNIVGKFWVYSVHFGMP